MTGAAPPALERQRRWNRLSEPWDIIVIGGGITGAGILWEGARRGYRVLLVEQNDFGSGSSSRSGQMVHGGLRYLRQGQFRLTWHSVQERQYLLRALPGLVRPLGFILPIYRSAPVSGTLLKTGLAVYDLMAGRRYHRSYSRQALDFLAPYLRSEGLLGGLWYQDALTDDARLVLRAIAEGEARGGLALNYARVESLLRSRSGAVEGVAVSDPLGGHTVEVRGRVVINASGIWADRLRGWLGRPPRLRLLRGSHLLFPAWRFPVAQGFNLFHPEDGRPTYVLPWEGVTLVGTTDLDHAAGADALPTITPPEVRYLLEVVDHYFPALNLDEGDVISTFSGVRAVVRTGKRDPSQEPREHGIWPEEVITVTGGKLTTFRLLARDALSRAEARLGDRPLGREAEPIDQSPSSRGGQAGAGRHLRNDSVVGERLIPRYGQAALAAIEHPDELEFIPGTSTRWVELRLAAREAVVHLDDLLLRRLRLGLALPQGGASLLGRVQPLVQGALGWDETRWRAEVKRYTDLWAASFAPPARPR